MKKLLISIALCEFAGIIGSFFTFSSVSTWFPTLTKPVFSPPNWLFGPVWTILYLLMGIALYLVWKRGLGDYHVKFAFWFFIVHLVVNSLWSFVFFGANNITGAFVVILILLGMIIWSMKLFWPINRLAAYLLIPYLTWVSFASVLNYYLMAVN